MSTPKRSTLPICVIADRMDLSMRRVRQMIDAGDIPAERIGARGHWRVPREFIEGFEAENARDQAAKAAKAAEAGRKLARSMRDPDA